jgi:ADP-ribose pyrophosphatase YjhB (NUDIX family)
MTTDDPGPESRPALELLDELRVLARNGPEYGDDPHDAYDEERYERLLALTSEWYGAALDLPPRAVRDRLAANVGHACAKVGADAALFDETGWIPLVRRADDGRWDLPGGFVEPNEAPAGTAVREAYEETGVSATVTELVDVFVEPPGTGTSPHTHVVVVYLSRADESTLRVRGSHEGETVQFWDVDTVPE